MLARLRFLSPINPILHSVTNKMHQNVQTNCSILNEIDTGGSNVLAEIFINECASTISILNQVRIVSSLYVNYSFDSKNIETILPDEMTTEQRHSYQILLATSKLNQEIEALLEPINITQTDVSNLEFILVEQFFKKNNPHDSFDQLHHITKHAWSIVNMLAFSNLFRFSNPIYLSIPTPDDSIFIPHGP
jgi:hypothetical protein